MVRRLLAQQPQHRFAVIPAEFHQFIHQGTLLLVTEQLVAATGCLQQLPAPLTLEPAFTRAGHRRQRNKMTEATLDH